MSKRLVFPFAFVASMTVAAAAHAADAGADVVTLKTGGAIRGTVTEVVPNDHATVLLAGGNTATVRWDVIQKIERGGVTIQNGPSAPPTKSVEVDVGGVSVVTQSGPTPAIVGTLQQPAGTLHVHIESERDVDLEELREYGQPALVDITTTDGTRERHVEVGRRRPRKEWVSVCSSPCDRDLPMDRTYRIGGSGVRHSKQFQLMGKPGDKVTIVVDASSSGAFVGGIVMAGVGVPFFVIGGLVLAVGAAIHDTGATTVGGTCFGIGAISLTVGIIMLTSNTHTDAKQSLGLVDRAPVWRTASGPALPAPAGLTIPFTF